MLERALGVFIVAMQKTGTTREGLRAVLTDVREQMHRVDGALTPSWADDVRELERVRAAARAVCDAEDKASLSSGQDHWIALVGAAIDQLKALPVSPSATAASDQPA